ncbi:MAG: Xanthine and CO dehydrogenase maturation factor, XdhC/CoxF family [Chloroflexi bacterium]|nr:MAG: Xanthine and CO dehydrogenase maturation factor, XdhC/CoxF family [Chloroflexota bacterium]
MVSEAEIKETYDIWKLLRAARIANKKAALSTVVRIRRSAYRREGAKLLIDQEGGMNGAISGGCLETDIREIAFQVMNSGEPRIVHYETGGMEDIVMGLGVGCDGEVDAFLEPVAEIRDFEVIEHAIDLMDREKSFVVATLLSSDDDGLHAGSKRLLQEDGDSMGGLGLEALDRAADEQASTYLFGEESRTVTLSFEREGRAYEAEVFFQSLVPLPALVIFGADDDSMPLVRFAAEMGFRVTVCDRRPAYVTKDRFPTADKLVRCFPPEVKEHIPFTERTYVVTKTHNYLNDREFFEQVIETPVPYIGMLGPKERRAGILADVQSERGPLSEADWERIHGPAGVDVGAEGAAQVALSVLGEIIAVKSSRPAGFLRERKSSIHARR